MNREEAIDAMLAVPPCDWWRFVGCRHCNAPRAEDCRGADGPARGPHIARRRSGLALHATLWLLDNGFAGDVLGVGVAGTPENGPERGQGAPDAPSPGPSSTGVISGPQIGAERFEGDV